MESTETGLVLLNAGRTLAIADELQKIVTEKKLSANIQGKIYVLVEGWQFAGSRLGIIPIAKDPIKLEGDPGDPSKNIAPELKYGCSVDLIRIDTGAIVGHGYALCSNRETNKRSFAEYAIASMAQTRAIGKAYRLLCGWLMKAAGFEATPAEEMDTVVRGDDEIPQALQKELESGLIGKFITATEVSAIKTAIQDLDIAPDYPKICIDLGISKIEELPALRIKEARTWVTMKRREAKEAKKESEGK